MNENYLHLRRLLTPLYGEREAQAVALLVMAEAFGRGRTAVFAGKGSDFSPAEAARFDNIKARLLAGEPVQHVLGGAYFGDWRFEVTRHTLVPRPETWELVEWCGEPFGGGAAHAGGPAAGLRVLDAGTGSGCIGIALKLLHPGWEVEAWDISGEALEVAARNARRLGAAVRFERRDLLADGAFERGAAGGFDLIVSNPPYIRESEKAGMARHVTDFEPHGALFVADDDPLVFYRALAEGAKKSLSPGGRLLVEINEALGAETAALFERTGLRCARVRRDAFGKPRMAGALL